MTQPTQDEAMRMAVHAGFTGQAAVMAPKEFHKLVAEAYERGAKEAPTKAATIIRADKWPTPRSAYHDQYNQQIEALAKRVEQIGETK